MAPGLRDTEFARQFGTGKQIGYNPNRFSASHELLQRILNRVERIAWEDCI